MADAYLKVKDNGANGLALVREEATGDISNFAAVTDFAESGSYTLDVAMLEPGSWNGLNKFSSTTRIRSKCLFRVREGMQVYYDNPEMDVFIGVSPVGSGSGVPTGYVNTGWIAASNYAGRYIVPIDGYMLFVFRANTGANITVDDYSCNVVISSDVGLSLGTLDREKFYNSAEVPTEYAFYDYASPTGATFEVITSEYDVDPLHMKGQKLLHITGTPTAGAGYNWFMQDYFRSIRDFNLMAGEICSVFLEGSPLVYLSVRFKDGGGNMILPNQNLLYGDVYDTNGNIHTMKTFVVPDGAYTMQFLLYVPADTYLGSSTYVYAPRIFTAPSNRRIAQMIQPVALPEYADFNDITQTGAWTVDGSLSANYYNNPLSSGATGFLTVKADLQKGVILQTVEGLTGMRTTRYSTNGGSSWSSWT